MSPYVESICSANGAAAAAAQCDSVQLETHGTVVRSNGPLTDPLTLDSALLSAIVWGFPYTVCYGTMFVLYCTAVTRLLDEVQTQSPRNRSEATHEVCGMKLARSLNVFNDRWL